MKTASSCPIRTLAYGGLVGARRYKPYTEYLVGASRVEEAAHCLLGSLGKAVHRFDYGVPLSEAIEGEWAHITEEMGIIARVAEEYGRPIYTNMINEPRPGREEDARDTVLDIRTAAPWAKEHAEQLKDQMYRNSDIPESLKVAGAATYNVAIAMAEALLRAVSPWPRPVGNPYADPHFRASVTRLQDVLVGLKGLSSQRVASRWLERQR